MKHLNRTFATACAVMMFTVALTSCSSPASSSTSSESTSSSSTSFQKPEKNVNLDLDTFPAADVMQQPSETFSETFEWENGEISGDVKVSTEKEGYTGEGYVSGFTEEGSNVLLSIEVPDTYYYDITLRNASLGGEKYNYLLVNGGDPYEFHTTDDQWQDATLSNVKLHKGVNTLSIQISWGWLCLDNVTVSTSEKVAVTNDSFNVEPTLINENANDTTKRLMQFLTDVYGKYTITGQQTSGYGKSSPEMIAIKKATGKYPALLGFDFMDDSPSRVEHGAKSRETELAIDWWNQGGLVAFSWHWNAPSKYLKDTEEYPWHGGFSTDYTTIDLEKIMNGEDQEGYDLLVSDIDAIAAKLKEMQEAGVTVIFRPLHEASGGWFWWGASGAEPYKKLWKLLVDRMTDYHKLNNIIWLWNGQGEDWYPGDDYVDIIGEDIYATSYDYSSQYAKFGRAAGCTSARKLITLSECGVIPSVGNMFADNARWSWFMTWSGEFVYNKQSMSYGEQYTSLAHFWEVYQSERVLTLEEIPDISSYKTSK